MCVLGVQALVDWWAELLKVNLQESLFMKLSTEKIIANLSFQKFVLWVPNQYLKSRVKLCRQTLYTNGAEVGDEA